MNNSSTKGIGTITVILGVALVFAVILVISLSAQFYIDRDIENSLERLEDQKTQAEVSKIRSDTAGSLFWLRLIALLVTVGGAVGGFLIGQSRITMEKLNFENRKNVDGVYQSIIQELADDPPVLRAAAAVKLGSILKSFPAEWLVSNERQLQIIQLTKQILAASLAIETSEKVLKTISISIVLHKSEASGNLADCRELDLSGANAVDAYWARCDFSYADFYRADLSKASFRKSDLSGAQFREATLNDAVLAETTCIGTNFKMADLRGVVFTNASLEGVNFEDAKVHSLTCEGATFKNIADCNVDVSIDGDGSEEVPVTVWLSGMNVLE